jgi:hypothetical protein
MKNTFRCETLNELRYLVDEVPEVRIEDDCLLTEPDVQLQLDLKDFSFLLGNR